MPDQRDEATELDCIDIDALAVRTVIGINDDERVRKQEVVVHLRLYCDLSIPGRSDRIEDTINYRSLTKEVIEFTEAAEFGLIESLAEGIARLALKPSQVRRVRVRVEKPGALRFAENVAVSIVRSASR